MDDLSGAVGLWTYKAKVNEGVKKKVDLVVDAEAFPDASDR